MSDLRPTKPNRPRVTVPERVGAEAEINYGRASAADFGPLSRDRIPVRAMRQSDLDRLAQIDARITGRDRRGYFEQKLEEALHESDVRVSLVAEIDGAPAGFIMARVDFGAFGRIEPIAVLDTIGVDPDQRGRGVGRALLSQLLINLATLRVERIRTELGWNEHDLLRFLNACGFRPAQTLCLQHAIR
jgi:ribosomal protein S18 acetylase RimI-like enzyme